MVDLGVRMLLHDRPRFAITVAGVAFAVMLVLTQTGLFLGLVDNSTITIERADADIWVVAHNTPNVDFAHALPEGHVQRVRGIQGVEKADNLIVAFMQMTLPTGAQENILVYALQDPTGWNLPWDVTEGSLDDLRRGQFLFMDESAVRRFGPFVVGEYREIAGNRLRIIGRTRGVQSFSTTPVVFMHFRTAQDLIPDGLAGQTTYILVRLAPGANSAAVQEEIRRRLPHTDVHDRQAWMRQTSTYWVDSTGLGLNMYLTVFLGSLIGVLVVALTLYTSTMEHLGEFGTVKAIGGSNADIYGILLRQATVAALLGFAGGAALAFMLRPLFATLHLKLIMPPAFIAASFVGTVVLCTASAVLSFRKVARIEPALVFRQ